MVEEEVLRLVVNGDAAAAAVRPNHTLLDVLRDNIGLTGTKHGCDDGSCGACTVLVDGRPTLACLCLALTVEGADIRTIEGAASNPQTNMLQRSLVEEGGLQCGYCTPGIVLAAHALLESHRRASPDERLDRDAIEIGLSNNLCRCTGYARIVAAVSQVASVGTVTEKR